MRPGSSLLEQVADLFESLACVQFTSGCFLALPFPNLGMQRHSLFL